MNVHYCPACGAGFWARANLGELEKVPTHKAKGEVVNCAGSRQEAPGRKWSDPAPELALVDGRGTPIGIDDLFLPELAP